MARRERDESEARTEVAEEARTRESEARPSDEVPTAAALAEAAAEPVADPAQPAVTEVEDETVTVRSTRPGLDPTDPLALIRRVDPEWEEGDPVWHLEFVTAGPTLVEVRLVGDLREVVRAQDAVRHPTEADARPPTDTSIIDQPGGTARTYDPENPSGTV